MGEMIRANDPRVARIMAEAKTQAKTSVFVNGRTYRVPASTAAHSTPLVDGAWAGQKCFIVGGGPSLKGFDFERLRGRGRVIAINKAFYDVPFADIVFAMDWELLGNIRSGKIDADYRAKNPNGPARDYQRAFAEFSGVKVWLNLSSYSFPPDVFSVPSAGATGWSKSFRTGLAHGQNSGYAALNLAIALGANPIYLLGYDCSKGPNGEKNYHDGYPGSGNPEALNTFKACFEAGAKLLPEGGPRIVNLNPNSAIAAFPKIDVDSILPVPKGEAYFDGCLGFGDNFQQRPIVREMLQHYKTVYVRTALPEAYWNIPGVKFVHPGSIGLHGQRRHMDSQPAGIYVDMPPGKIPTRSWKKEWPVQMPGRPGVSISKYIKDHNEIEAYDFSFPLKGEWITEARKVLAGLNTGGKKVCIIRRPVDRTEFNCPARNPKTEYFQMLINKYANEYFFISLGSIEESREWHAGGLTGIDAAFDRGELPLTTIFGLVKLADMTITTPGFFMPLAIALRARAFVIFGGHTAPEIHIDPVMGTASLAYVAPDPFCRCLNNTHRCNKDIPEAKIISAFEELRNRGRSGSTEPVRWESLNRIASGPPPAADPEKKKLPEIIYFQGCYGFGDNLNQRPVVRHLADRYEAVYLKTTVPEFYWDLPNVKFVFPDGVAVEHRTHAKHALALPASTFAECPVGAKPFRWNFKLQRIIGEDGRIRYIEEDAAGDARDVPAPAVQLSICEDIRRRADIPPEKYDYSLPVRNVWVKAARELLATLETKGKKVCLINPPTTRAEWPCVSRNPKVEYFQELVDRYKNEYFFMSIADIEEGKEVLAGDLRGIDAEFHRGELPLTTILGLLKIADMTICPPAWMMNMAIAVRGKVFVIFGGHAGPEYLLDPIMGLDNLEYAAPRPFCNCWRMDHACRKDIDIPEMLARFEVFRARPKQLKEVTMGFPPGIGDVHWPALILESFKERKGIDRLIVRFKEEWDYTSAFLRSLPFVDSVETNKNNLPFSFSLAGGHGRPLYKNKAGLDYMIDYGSSLERGVLFENVMPEYEPNWEYEIRGLEAYDAYVADLRARAGGRLVAIYTANKGGNKHWASSDWTVESWMELARLIHAENGCRVALVGMQFDHSYAVDLKDLDKDNLIIDLTGQTPIMQTLAILRAADLFIGFSCGLDMLTVHFHTPTVEFWPIRGISKGGVYNAAFMTSWLPPWARHSDSYVPVVYGPESKPELILPKIRKFL